MSTLILRLKVAPALDVDLNGITPDVLKDKRLVEIRRLKLRHGQRETALGELFDVDGEIGGDELEIHGACARLHHVGTGMRAGQLRVIGDCGAWLGSEMRGGTLSVRGNAGDGIGASMRGGLIDISGNAGDYLGAPIPGAVSGMKGGTILVQRRAGRRAGDRMRRGLIVIGGDAGNACGSQMIAGSIVVLGTVGPGVGTGMRRGTIALAQPPAGLGASFALNGHFDLAFTQLLLRHVGGLKSAWRTRLSRLSAVERWVGDAGGMGEILILS